MASLSKKNYNPEEYLLDTLDNLDIGFVKVSNDGIILNHNLNFNKIFGYDPQKNLIGTKTLDYWLNSEERNKFRDILFKDGIVKKYITPAKKLDGEKICLNVNIKLNKNSKGEIISSEGTFIDVTERIADEQKLRESEKKFRTAVENSPDFIVIIKRDGTILEVNRLEQGFTREMVIGQSVFSEYFYETKNQLKFVRKAISDSLESREISQFEYSQIAPDGSFAFYETKLSPFEYDEEDRIISLQLTTRNITERKVKEKDLKDSEKKLKKLAQKLEQKVEKRTKKLRESEEKWRALSENSPAHIMLLDNEHKILSINRTVPDLSKEEVIGASVYTFVPQEFHQIARNSFNSVWETGKPVTYSTNYITKEGNIRFFDVWVGPVFQSGSITALVGHSMDVTEIKVAELKLRESEMFVKSILNTTPSYIYIYDLEKNKNIYSAPHSEVMLGYTPEEMRNMGDSRLPNLIHPDDEIILKQTIQKVINAKDNEIIKGEYRFRHKNGKYVHIFDRSMVFKRTADG